MLDPIPKELYEILLCPKCKSDLVYADNKEALQCAKCLKKYKIQEGIVRMID